MKKIEIICLSMAAVAIILFWVFGFNGKMNLAQVSLIVAGGSCWFVLISYFINWLRNQWLA